MNTEAWTAEDEALRQKLDAHAETLDGVAKAIASSEEFKREVASAGKAVWAILEPFLVAAATASPGGPAAGALAHAAGSMIAAQLDARAKKGA